MIKTASEEELISRPGLARRWKCHVESLKRREKKGLLHPIALSSRMIRYDMAEVHALEQEAAAKGLKTGTYIPGRFVSTSLSAPASALTSKRRRPHGVPMKRSPKPTGVNVTLTMDTSQSCAIEK